MDRVRTYGYREEEEEEAIHLSWPRHVIFRRRALTFESTFLRAPWTLDSFVVHTVTHRHQGQSKYLFGTAICKCIIRIHRWQTFTSRLMFYGGHETYEIAMMCCSFCEHLCPHV